MKKYFGFVAVSAFLFSCANDTRDNQYDERAGKSSAEGSSSSVGGVSDKGNNIGNYRTVVIGTQSPVRVLHCFIWPSFFQIRAFALRNLDGGEFELRRCRKQVL